MRFSIVMPTYNPPLERFKAAVKSVQEQSWRDWELVIVDDGATDQGFLTALGEYADAESRIRVLRQPNRGVSAARNAGTGIAQGDYVMYMDADDELTPHALSDAASALSGHDVDALFAYVQYLRDPAEKSDIQSASIRTLSPNEKTEMFRWTLAGGKNRVAPRQDSMVIKNGPVARLIRRELAVRTPFPEGIPVSEDTLWSLSLIDRASVLGVQESLWYWYWVGHSSASRGFRPRIFEETQRLMESFGSTLQSTSTPVSRGDIASRVLGEINRTVKLHYARPECTLPWRQRREQIHRMLDNPAMAVTLADARSAGYKNAVKYLLLRSGLTLSSSIKFPKP